MNVYIPDNLVKNKVNSSKIYEILEKYCKSDLDMDLEKACFEIKSLGESKVADALRNRVLRIYN